MDFKKLLSFIPGWVGFLLLLIVGVAMMLNGSIEPFGALEPGQKTGFIVFGAMATVVGAVSWIIGGTSEVAGKTGKVGVLVKVQDMPWWGWVIDGGVVVVAIVLYLALK